MESLFHFAEAALTEEWDRVPRVFQPMAHELQRIQREKNACINETERKAVRVDGFKRLVGLAAPVILQVAVQTEAIPKEPPRFALPRWEE